MARGKFSVRSTYVGESGDMNFLSKFNKHQLLDNFSSISRHNYYGDFSLSFCMRDEDVVGHILDLNKIEKIWFDSLENKLIIEGCIGKIEFDGRCVPHVVLRKGAREEDISLFEGDIFCSEQYGMNTRDFVLGKKHSNNKRRANLPIEQHNSIKNHVSLKFLYEITKRFCLLDLTFAFEWSDKYSNFTYRKRHSSSLKLIYNSDMIETYRKNRENHADEDERINSLKKKYYLITKNSLCDSPKEFVDWRIMDLCWNELEDLGKRQRELKYTFFSIKEKMTELMSEIKTNLDEVEIFD